MSITDRGPFHGVPSKESALTTIVWDIETRYPPAYDPAWLARVARVDAEPVEADKRLTDPAKIAADVEAKRAKRIADLRDRAPLDPTIGMVACIGFAVDDRDAEAIGDFTASLDALDAERATLLTFAEILAHRITPRLVAHNGAGFDAPFIQARAMVHYARTGDAAFARLARRMGKLGGKPWESPIVDTAALWPTCGYGGSKGSAKLTDICAALGIVRAPSIPSAEVPAAWDRGDREAVRTHVLADVDDLRAVWRVIREVM